ncbi:MAG: glycosyltransferase family 4 protein [Chitinophagaceae bacterium]|nr:glycosyltransferase family 4 protein [Chitinophagaceae bacterium]
MKVGFAARWSPLDKRSWSGTSYYSYQEIKKRNEVEIFQFKWPWYLRERLTTQKSLNRRLFGKQTAVEFTKAYARYYSRQLQKELKKRPVDVLFVSASSQLIAYLKTDIPIIYMTDATFQQIQGYYPYFSNLAAYNVREGIALDKNAFQNAAHCILASEWNRRSAISDYGIDSGKISVTPIGANIDKIPAENELYHQQQGTCRLLFLGVEWDRKGGDIALDAYRILKEKGKNPNLHIIGCVPPHDISDDKDITVIPFLDKNSPADFQQLDHIFRNTDFLLLPTRAECAGVVFSEASAYGIPSITTDTGGVTTYVKNGINGFALPLEARGNIYAEKILSILDDPGSHRSLRQNSRKLYERELNWNTWGDSFQRISEKVLNEKIQGK